MGSTYYLGWPGLETAPVHLIDVIEHRIFNRRKPVPAAVAQSLNKIENRYVELSWIVNRFPINQQQSALNILMKLVGDLAMPKFYVGPDNVAYVPLNTLFTFVVCYPQNNNFRVCRNSLLNHLGNFLELPCSICGYIRRDCICETRLYDMDRDHFIGAITEIHSKGIQCQISEEQTEQTIFRHPFKPVYTASDKLQEIVDEVARGGGSVDDVSKAKDNPPGEPMPGYPWGQMYQPFLPPPPPLPPPPKPKMREIGIQTRAVYDFSNRKKRLSKKEREDEAIIEAQIAASENVKSTPAIPEEKNESEEDTEKTGEEKKDETEEGATPQVQTSTEEKNPLAVVNTPTPSSPVKISLWTLIDTDDESSEDENDTTAHNDKEKAKEVQEEEKSDPIRTEEQKEATETENKDLGTEENPSAKPAQVKNTENIESQDHHLHKMEREIIEPMDVTAENGFVENLSSSASEKHEQEPIGGSSSIIAIVDSERKSLLESPCSDDSVTRLQRVIQEVEMLSPGKVASLTKSPQQVKSPISTENQIAFESATKAQTTTAPPSGERCEPAEDEASKQTTVQGKASLHPEDPEPVIQPVGAQTSTEAQSDDPAALLMKSVQTPASSTSDASKTEGSTEVLCEITGRVNEHGAEPVKEQIVIPLSPPPSAPLPEAVKPKPKLLAKKWAQKFEYAPTKETIYRCTFSRCSQCFDTKHAAKLHDKAHGAFGQENPTHLVCWECDTYTTSFSKWYDLLRHLRVKHEITIPKSKGSHEAFLCTFCGVPCETEEALSYHINFHYLGKYKCVHCGILLLSWKQVQLHLEKECTEAVSRKEKKLGCPYCSFVFHIRNMRNIHMLSHIDEGLVCIFCENNEVWENWKQLRKHYQQKHGRKVTSAMNPLKPTKMEIKHDPQCHVCQKEFKVFEDYVYHMRKVHDFVAYVATDCAYCEKTFRTQKAYDWHSKNTHGIGADGKLTALRCTQCEYVATNKQMLRAHVAKKHEEKQHECNECGKLFSHYNQLRVHMVKHARKAMYPCKVCDAEFSRHVDLRNHVKEEHGKRSASSEAREGKQCPECNCRCSSTSSLEAHLERYHPEYSEASFAADADAEDPDFSDPDFQPALKISPPPLDPTLLPPKAVKPKGRRNYYKGGRRGRGRGRGRGAAASGSGSVRSTGGRGGKSLPYLKGEKRPGRKASTDMPEIGMSLDGVPELMAGGPVDRNDKKKIKRLLKIKEQRIKFQQKACCARSISYQDHMAMKTLGSSTNFSPIANFELNGEPMHKRRRMSSTSNIPLYAQQSSYQSTYSPYEPSVKLPTQIPESYDLLKYPFIDHCYFKMEGMALPESPLVGPGLYEQDNSNHASTSQELDTRDAVPGTGMMRGVYTPTAWGSGGASNNTNEDVDVGFNDGPQGHSEYRTFPSTSFAPPPPPPPGRRSSDTSKRPPRRGGRGKASTRKPSAAGKFVPLAPSHEYARGIQDSSSNDASNIDTVPLDQLSMDGDVAVQHEVGEGDVSFSEDVFSSAGGDDELIQGTAAEELIETLPQDNLLKDIISQLEHRMQNSSSNVPQSPTMSALMRTLMQSPPRSTTKVAGRRLSLSGGAGGNNSTSSTPQHQSLFDNVSESTLPSPTNSLSNSTSIQQISGITAMSSNAASSTVSSSLGSAEQQTEVNEDCMVVTQTQQSEMPSDTIVSILPSTGSTCITASTSSSSEIDEAALNEVYQLLGSKFDSLDDLQKQIGLSVTSPSPKSNQQSTAAITSPELIYSSKSTPAASTHTAASYSIGPGSTARYRTMAKPSTVSMASSTNPRPTVTSTQQVVYTSAGMKQVRRVIQTPQVQQKQLSTDTVNSQTLASAQSTPTMVTSVVSTPQGQVKVMSQASQAVSSVSTPVPSAARNRTSLLTPVQYSISSAPSTVTTTASANSSSGRIPVRIQLPSSSGGATGGPMRIQLPSGTSLGQNIKKISLQQLLQAGGSIQSGPTAGGGGINRGGARLITVSSGSISAPNSGGTSLLTSTSAMNQGITVPRIRPVSSTQPMIQGSRAPTITMFPISQGNSTSPRIMSLSSIPGQASGSSPRFMTVRPGQQQTVRIGGKNYITIPRPQQQQGDGRPRIVQVARRQMPSASAVKADEETEAAVASLAQAEAMEEEEEDTAYNILNSTQQTTHPAMDEIRDDLMDSLQTDEEIARNIQAADEQDPMEGVVEEEMQL